MEARRGRRDFLVSDLFETSKIHTVPIDGEKGRIERRAFFTPDLLSLAICRTLLAEGVKPSSILEPGCGGGAFLRAAAATWPSAELSGVDVLPACDGPGRVTTGDLFDARGPVDLVLGNPDFTIAEKVVRHGMSILNPGGYVAFLLLDSFEESSGRVPLYEQFPLWLRQQIAQRATFTADGQTDQRPYALFVWKQGWAGPYYKGLRPLVWR
jgi:hypothetical protein